MEYFILAQDRRVTALEIPAGLIKAVPPRIVRTKRDKKPAEVMSFPVHNKPDSEYPAVIDRPVFILANTAVKEIFSKYDRDILFTPVMFNDIKNQEQHLYWLMNVKAADCLAAETVFYPNHTLCKLVLDESKIIQKPIFKIGGVLEEYLAIRLDVAESLLRRDTIYGITLKPILTNHKEE